MLPYSRVPSVTSPRLIRRRPLPDSLVRNLIVMPGLRQPRPCVRQIVFGLTDKRAPQPWRSRQTRRARLGAPRPGRPWLRLGGSRGGASERAEPEQADERLRVAIRPDHVVDLAERDVDDLDPLDLVGVGLLVV